MKLVKVEHDRCSDNAAATTWLWAPDDITEDKLSADADAACDAYLVAEERLDKELQCRWTLPAAPSLAFIQTHQNTSVADMLALWDAECKAAEEQVKERKKLRVPFSGYMRRLGYIPFEEMEDVPTTTVYWGHRHGTHIDYSETAFKDIPAPGTKERAERIPLRTQVVEVQG